MKNIGYLLSLIVLGLLSCTQEAKGPDYYVMPVVDTGVTKRLYERMGTRQENICELTRRGKEDADYNDPSNQPSYTKFDAKGEPLPDSAEQWALVQDNITGRIWEAKTDDDSIHDRDTLFTFEEAQDHVRQLNEMKFGGYSNWRIPNLKELSSVIHFGKTLPSINAKYFPYQYSSFYWSSTECVDDDRYAWGVFFQRGEVLNHFKRVQYFFRAVCLGGWAIDHVEKYSDQAARFHDNGDGTITDFATALMWQKGYAGDVNGDGEIEKFKWRGARAYCEESDYAGFQDWRMPNINELMSIVDYSRSYPAINGAFDDDIRDGDVFSSTPNGRSQCPYIINLGLGNIDIAGTPSYTRLVRDCDNLNGM